MSGTTPNLATDMALSRIQVIIERLKIQDILNIGSVEAIESST